jgi:prepilin-type N-terminal cleavage/methylation domain-containing protein
MHGPARRGFTLFEVLLSLSIAVMLLAAVYATIGYQLQSARAGREVIERSTLSRSLFTRISADVMAASTLVDPGRYRRLQKGSGSGGMTGGTTAPATAGGATTGAAGAQSTTTAPTTPASSSTDTEEMPPEVPIGIVGDSTTLNLFVTKVPGEALPGRNGEAALVTSDLRRISYWLGDGGLCRMEAKIITSQEALSETLPSDDANYRIAPEVKSVEFSYFDGEGWVDSWNSTKLDEEGDGVTPIGPPRAIAVKIGFLPPPSSDGTQETELKYLRHVIVIPTGGGAAQAAPPGAATSP